MESARIEPGVVGDAADYLRHDNPGTKVFDGLVVEVSNLACDVTPKSRPVQLEESKTRRLSRTVRSAESSA